MGLLRMRWWYWIAGLAILLAGGLAVVLPSAHGTGMNSLNALPAPVLGTAPPRLRIVVIGGTSGIGLEVAKLALSRGHSVTVMARHAPKDLLSGARFIAGDIQDANAVAAAVREQTAVVTSVGVAPSREPVALFSAGMANVLRAMHASGVSRLLAVTGIGAGDSRGHGGFGYDQVFMPLMMHNMYEDKTREEAEIRESGLDWTIVRPGFLSDGGPLGRYRVVSDLTGVTSGSISRTDVAHYIIAAIENGLAVRDAVLLTD
jgi:putative NADH-flavin reductase